MEQVATVTSAVEAATKPFPPLVYKDLAFSFTEFRDGAKVADIGCGSGEQMRDLLLMGVDVVGVEVTEAMVAEGVRRGLDVRHGFAEKLPLESASVDGIVCKVVLPYTDERTAVAEWGRVIKANGEIRASFHGMGYGVLYMFTAATFGGRVYGLRMLVNSLWYGVFGRRLGGWVGDTLCQTERRLKKYYRREKLELLASTTGATYFGLPVYIYHHIRKCG